MIIDLTQFGTDLKDGDEGEKRHRPQLDRALRTVAADDIATIDLSGVDFMGYAYARQTLVPCVQAVRDGRYPVRSALLRDERERRGGELEGLALALAEARLTLVLQRAGGVESVGYLSREQPFESRRAQVKRQKMLNILTLLQSGEALYTNDISARLGLTPPNCNYLLGELERQGLVRRDKETHPSGGPVYLNRAAPTGLFAPMAG